MFQPEYWVCRVLMHKGPPWGPMRSAQLNEKSHQEVMAKIIAGELTVSSEDDAILEPIVGFSVEQAAHDHRDELAKSDSKRDYRVVLSVEVQ